MSPHCQGGCDGCGDGIACLRDELERLRDGRDRWVRLFNRLEAAITHHQKNRGSWFDEVDEALWVARTKILKAAAEPPAGAR